MTAVVRESHEVLLEPVKRNVLRWNAASARGQHLDHVAQQLVGLVELLVELVDAAVQPGALLEADRLEHPRDAHDRLDTGTGEPLRVSIREQLIQIRKAVAHLRSLTHSPAESNEPGGSREEASPGSSTPGG